MTGVELVAGYLVAWAVRKARRVAGRADAQVDRALDAGLDRLRDVVSQRLPGDAALARLAAEAAERGDVSERTRQRVALAVEEAAEQDPRFAATVAELVGTLAGGAGVAVVAGDHGLAAGGGVGIRASGHGVAAGVIGGQLSIANPPGPGPTAPQRHPATHWR
ncbi:MAG: hypothetical protein V7603_3805 [Micromonosporaceae bacterium]